MQRVGGGAQHHAPATVSTAPSHPAAPPCPSSNGESCSALRPAQATPQASAVSCEGRGQPGRQVWSCEHNSKSRSLYLSPSPPVPLLRASTPTSHRWQRSIDQPSTHTCKHTQTHTPLHDNFHIFCRQTTVVANSIINRASSDRNGFDFTTLHCAAFRNPTVIQT
eukprot:365277-Chlamydomonas_euryale.AAC.13